ncbi:hypothetical protein [Stieleria marina]
MNRTLRKGLLDMIGSTKGRHLQQKCCVVIVMQIEKEREWLG